jgi:hypothetical protein
MFYESLSERLNAMVCGWYHLCICYGVPKCPCFQCVLIAVSSCSVCFPEMVIEVQMVRYFPCRRHGDCTVVLEYWARILVLQGHIIVNLRYSIFLHKSWRSVMLGCSFFDISSQQGFHPLFKFSGAVKVLLCLFYCYVCVLSLLCMFCSVYSVFIVPTGTLRLP